jgi:hypothetical protein
MQSTCDLRSPESNALVQLLHGVHVRSFSVLVGLRAEMLGKLPLLRSGKLENKGFLFRRPGWSRSRLRESSRVDASRSRQRLAVCSATWSLQRVGESLNAR